MLLRAFGDQKRLLSRILSDIRSVTGFLRAVYNPDLPQQCDQVIQKTDLLRNQLRHGPVLEHDDG
jgi:hypothetical protein